MGLTPEDDFVLRVVQVRVCVRVCACMHARALASAVCWPYQGGPPSPCSTNPVPPHA